ncbi:MAG: phosphohydrolase [Deltaproteobacteria bacterium]|nr:phosphohydrolase [Deltaproteobacteria bacterium]
MRRNGEVLARYDNLLTRVVDRRDAIQQFDDFLRKETAWLTAPASTQLHLAEEGGLLEHSVNVATTLLLLRDALAPDIPTESCVIVGLYHDPGKVGVPGKPYYLPNPSQWHVHNRGIRYIVNNDVVHLDIATRSLYLIAQHVPLTDDEAQAIRFHDGKYIPKNQSVAHREVQLTRLVQYADTWAAGVLEARVPESSGARRIAAI